MLFPKCNFPNVLVLIDARVSCFSAVIVTTSSNPDRLKRYLAVGDVNLSDQDIQDIDHAGKKGQDKTITHVCLGLFLLLALFLSAPRWVGQLQHCQ